MPDSEYVFTERPQEQRRLETQAEAFAPLTERLFHAAGLRPGMRVLDLGSGAGEVTMLAAALAGPDGEADTGALVVPRNASARRRRAADGLVPARCVYRRRVAPPAMRLESDISGGAQARAWGWANVIRGVIPLMERFGIATAADVDPDTLEERLLADVNAAEGVVIGPPPVGAWCRAAP